MISANINILRREAPYAYFFAGGVTVRAGGQAVEEWPFSRLVQRQPYLQAFAGIFCFLILFPDAALRFRLWVNLRRKIWYNRKEFLWNLETNTVELSKPDIYRGHKRPGAARIGTRCLPRVDRLRAGAAGRMASRGLL